MVLADDASPTFMGGGYEVMMSMFLDLEKVQKAFVDGTGLGWHDHHACPFSGTERFFRAGYNANLEPSWIPALDGMVERLRAGTRVARVEDNLNPVGRVFYSASTMVCTPCSLLQEVGLGLGAQAGEKRLRGVGELS